MTRREFLKRSAPLVAAGLVAPSFVEQLIFRLFGPKKFWDFRAPEPLELFTSMNRIGESRAFLNVDYSGLEMRVAAEFARKYELCGLSETVLSGKSGPGDCLLCHYSTPKPKALIPVRRLDEHVLVTASNRIRKRG